MTIFYFIIMLGVLIAIHEAGHMLVGKLFGLYVREFAIGFGPQIFSKQGKETKYSLRLIPLGGFTGFIESESDNDPESPDYVEIDSSRTFYGAKPLARIMVLLAGPIANILLAMIVFSSIFVASPYKVVYPPAVVGEVSINSPAYEAGMLAGDTIVKIVYSNNDEVEIKTTYDLSVNNQLHSGSMIVSVERDGQIIDLEITPRYSEESKSYIMGIMLDGNITYEKMSVIEAIGYGISSTFENVGITIKSIINMFSGQVGLENLSGTIGIYSYTQEAVSYGFLTYLSLVGSISISLAIMNLIPIPVFDGGRILLTVIEMIIGRRLNKKVEETLMIIGVLLILALFLLTTVLDVSKLLK